MKKFRLPYEVLKAAVPTLPDYPTSTTILHFWTPLDLQAAKEDVAEYPFENALVTYGGRPSDHPVGGTEKIKGGPYRVLIPASLLAKKIGDLRGKKVFAAESLDGHNNSYEIGVFTKAWTEPVGEDENAPGNVVLAARASGLLFRDRHPELTASVIELAKANKLGLSYDIKDVLFRLDEVNGERVLVVVDFAWRGATILKKENAAYELTQLAAHSILEEDKEMDIKELHAALEAALNKYHDDVVKPLVEKVNSLEQSSEEKAKLAAQAVANEVMEKMEAFSASIEEVKAEMKSPVTELPQTESPSDEKDETMKVSDFIAQIGAEFRKAVEPLAEKISKLEGSQTGSSSDTTAAKGIRKSLGASQVALVEKYAQKGQTGELTAESIAATIEMIKQDPNLSKSKKMELVASLSASRRELLRQENLRAAMGVAD